MHTWVRHWDRAKPYRNIDQHTAQFIKGSRSTHISFQIGVGQSLFHGESFLRIESEGLGEEVDGSFASLREKLREGLLSPEW